MPKRLCWHCVLAFIVMSVLLGCANDSTQQQAFKHFLNEQLTEMSGVQMTRLSVDQRRKLGSYVQGVDILENFETQLNEDMAVKMPDIIKLTRFRQMKDIVTHKADFEAASAQIEVVSLLISENVRVALTEKNNLKQPADLQTLYDQVFDKKITQTAHQLSMVALPQMKKALDNINDCIYFVTTHPENVKLNGGINIQDPKVKIEWQKKQDNVRIAIQQLLDAQDKILQVMNG